MEMQIRADVLNDILSSPQSIGNDEAVMELKDDRWLMKSKNHADAMMYAARVKDTAMNKYNKGKHDAIGVRLKRITKFIGNDDSMVNVVYKQDSSGLLRLHVEYNGRKAALPTTDIGYVSNHQENVPRPEYPFTIHGDLSFLDSFIKDAEAVTGGNALIISVRDETFYLYSKKDDSEIYDEYEYDEFGSVEVDWSKATQGGAGLKDPEGEEALDAYFSSEFFKDISSSTDEGHLQVSNQGPAQLIYHPQEGVDSSWIVTPRIDKEGELGTLPDRIAKA